MRVIKRLFCSKLRRHSISNESDFFRKPTTSSLCKAKLVADYFDTWSSILLPTVKRTHNRFGYIDFFSGPGKYDDGTESTPLLVLNKAINHPEKCKMLVSIFNDGNIKHTDQLKRNIERLKGYENLRYKPVFKNTPMDKDSKIIEELKLEETRLIPTLFFIDPFGYKGLSLTLIHSVLKDWGSDGIFFFNYQRINSAINNNFMKSHMEILFGNKRFAKLRTAATDLASRQRELLILDYLMEAINEIGGNYVLDYRFPHYGENRTSHYLIFVTKHIKGYKVMKEILAKHSSSDTQGVASFEFDPTIEYISDSPLPSFEGPLDKLARKLAEHFRGRKLSMAKIYEEHDQGDSFTRHYTEANYKQALLKLEESNKIIVDKPRDKRIRSGKLTLGNDRIITFIK